MKKSKPVLMWGGFVKDRLDHQSTHTGFGGWGSTFIDVPAVFCKRKDARAEYQDVRRVEIRETATRTKARRRDDVFG